MRFLLALCALLLAAPATAIAAAYRYEFDVVSSDIGYVALGIRDAPGPTEEEKQDFIAAFHALGSLVGMTGHNILEVHIPDPYFATFKCIAGFICPQTRAGITYASPTTFGIVGSHMWHLSEGAVPGVGRASFNDDGYFSGVETFDGKEYFAYIPVATFEIENLVITAVPLPAGGWLLIAALLFLRRLRRLPGALIRRRSIRSAPARSS